MGIKRYLKYRYIISFFRVVIIKFTNINKLNIKGIKYYFGKNLKIDISKGGKLILDEKVYISNNCEFECSGGYINIGRNTFFNSSCKVISMDSINIGSNCLIGPNVCVYDHNHEYSLNEELICKQGFKIKKVIIGSDVWLGANVVITSGVKIGSHVVIGANSVVTKDIESNSVYSGNPAKFIKKI